MAFRKPAIPQATDNRSHQFPAQWLKLEKKGIDHASRYLPQLSRYRSNLAGLR